MLSGFMLVVITYIGNSYFHVRKGTMFSINHNFQKLYDILRNWSVITTYPEFRLTTKYREPIFLKISNKRCKKNHDRKKEGHKR